jgi:hypothetical protein
MAKERRKKDGKDAGKKRRRMREAEAQRHANAQPQRPQSDQPDVVEYKPGSASDRSRVGAT